MNLLVIRRFLFVVLLAVGQSIAAFPARAQEVKLVSGNEYVPFSGEDLPGGGMTTEIVRTVFARIGDTIKVDFKPWKRGYEEARENLYAGTFPYTKNAERLADFIFSEPIFSSRAVFFAHRDAKIHFTRDIDLKGLTACNALGFNTRNIKHLLDANIITLTQLPTLERCFKMLEARRVDLIPVTEATGKVLVRSLYGANADIFKILDKPLEESVLHFIVSKNYPDGEKIIKRFNAALHEAKQDGTLKAIVNKHLHQ